MLLFNQIDADKIHSNLYAAVLPIELPPACGREDRDRTCNMQPPNEVFAVCNAACKLVDADKIHDRLLTRWDVSHHTASVNFQMPTEVTVMCNAANALSG